MEPVSEQIRMVATQLGLRLITAVVVFAVGFWLSGLIRNLIENVMTRAQFDPTLRSFVSNFSYVALLAFVILATLAELGIQTASIIAVLGAAGLAIGLALQGSLSNFAAGVLMIIFRPFRVGDYIEGAGTGGTVEEIQIFSTLLKSPDNRRIVVPNAKLAGDNIVNYSAMSTRRIDLVFGVSYSDDVDQVKATIADVLNQDSRILKDPAPIIAVLALADSSVNFAVRPWVMTADYWDVYFDLNERMKKRLDQEGITIPFPQQDVHVFQTVSNGQKATPEH